uniref:MAK10-like protein n=1 Tax=Tanacetum cinerariifolium TaxID=118510 RepID=A0A6L2KPR6_TANCI|nr:hypothetical protein [Tanacetum cinerariifolium]
MNDLESDDELVDTPTVAPFPHLDNDSDGGEVLNELIEYGNVGMLRQEKEINSFDEDDLAFQCMIGFRKSVTYFDPFLPMNIITRKAYNTIMVEGLESIEKNLVAIVRDVYVFVGSFTYITDFVVLKDIGEVVFGKPFARKTGLVYDPEEGAITFEKDNEKITLKMPHKMEAFNHMDSKDGNLIDGKSISSEMRSYGSTMLSTRAGKFSISIESKTASTRNLRNVEGIVDIFEFFRKLKFICHWANPIKDLKWSNVPVVKLSLLSKSDDTFLSLQALSNLHYLFSGFMDYFWSFGKLSLGLRPRYTSCFSGCSRRCSILNCFNLGGVNMKSLTINYVPEKLHDTDPEIIVGELGIQFLLSGISIVFSWGGSISLKGFQPFILLLTVIIVAIAIVVAVVLLVVDVIIGIVVVVVVGVSSIIKLSFVITGDLVGLLYSNRLGVCIPPGQGIIADETNCSFRTIEVERLTTYKLFVVSSFYYRSFSWSGVLIDADATDVDFLLGGILST